jgi:hypothetical protein
VQLLVEVLIRELVALLEALHGVATAELAIEGHDRRVAVQA